ncbi:MAG: hypothetical protein PHI35_04140 [Victivallaceae bacterium]|nr:hypothetical protein [Victivallaceae bacterium]
MNFFCEKNASLRRVAAAGLIVILAAGGAFWLGRATAAVEKSDAPQSALPPVEPRRAPSPDQLKKLARSALRDAGLADEKPGGVTICGNFPDGSFAVAVMLASGRQVSGRLYLDRQRWRIAVDRTELYSRETIVKIKE